MTVTILPSLDPVGQPMLARKAGEIEWSSEIDGEWATRTGRFIDALDLIAQRELVRRKRTKPFADPWRNVHEEA